MRSDSNLHIKINKFSNVSLKIIYTNIN